MIWLVNLVDRFVLDADDLASARGLAVGVGLTGAEAAMSCLTACRVLGEAADDPEGLILALDGLSGLTATEAIGALVARCFAAVRVDYPSRQDAQAGRAALSAAAEPVYGAAGTEAGPDVLAFVVRLVGQAATEISAIAATRSPLVRVETGVSLPSSLLAWDLYGDPDRGRELVQRNRTGTSMVMPIVLEALAS
ncbi:hypothetical protein Sa4125_25070 [Aureimonas sp. SA4125]|uniref:hypothetical protein n=1 Tax=Aureimonas sp. SA4125 TaxID=2826993 RepID=UPI001CC53D3D|nr:hypothetical protein [Aureimonas sp. SA4125]BDA84965.1 hypothetical protein Sa4125_25070 [Aureimonas sp. SA4125]